MYNNYQPYPYGAYPQQPQLAPAPFFVPTQYFPQQQLDPRMQQMFHQYPPFQGGYPYPFVPMPSTISFYPIHPLPTPQPHMGPSIQKKVESLPAVQDLKLTSDEVGYAVEETDVLNISENKEEEEQKESQSSASSSSTSSRDLKLSSDEVGYAVVDSEEEVLPFLTSAVAKDLKISGDDAGLAVVALIKEVPASKKAPEFDHPVILEKYIARTKTKDIQLYLPVKGYSLFQKITKSKDYFYKEWEEAMLHNPPVEMLNVLDRIQSIYTTYQTPLKNLFPRFLFPCSLSVCDAIRKKYKNIQKFADLIAKQDKMVLELTVMLEGKPIHVFLRPLRNEEDFLKRNLGENKEKVYELLEETQYPQLTHKNQQTKNKKATTANPVVETETYFEFYSPYGTTIKALKAIKPAENSE